MSEPKRRRRWPYGVLGFIVLLVVLVLAFQWDWLIPIIEPRASAALGRPVRLAHLHVTLGHTTHIVADGVAIGNPAGWPGGGDFATAEHLVVDVDADKLIHGRHIVLPAITLERPVVDAQQLPDKSANWALGGSGGSSSSSGSSDEGPQLGKLTINDGSVHVRSAPLNADFNIGVSTRAAPDGKDQIVASAKGTYAKAPISAEFVGGALLSLRDAADPYPVDLHVTNGPTTASAIGTVSNPLAFAGLNVRLELAGPDMSLLLPLTGIAIPKTPPYRIAGKLDYADRVVKFDDFTGRVGSSDLEGSLGVDTKPTRPVLTADLQSKMVDLKDLGGFIGAEPGDPDKGTKKPTAPSNGKVLPTDKLSLPKLNVADVHLKYQARRIEGQRQPLDNMVAALDIVNGDVSLHPLSFGIGRGKISSQIQLAERGSNLAAKADVDFQRVDVGKLMAATGVGQGAGAIGGRALIEGTGDSVAQILGDGNGELKLYMGAGGDLSALLVDISGLQFGNALLSALGVPNRTQIQCLITDFVLTNGRAESRLTMLDTDEGRVGITGDVNLKSEALNLNLRTEAKHFSVGSLPAAIGINGTLGKPGIQPDLAEAGTRAAAAAGLGVLLTPLAALLPTIQMGTGEDNACSSLLHEVQTPPRVAAPVAAKPTVAPVKRRRR